MDEVQAVLERELAAAEERIAEAEKVLAADRERAKRLRRFLAEWAKGGEPPAPPRRTSQPERALQFDKEALRPLPLTKALVQLAQDNDGYVTVSEAAMVAIQLGYFETPQQASMGVSNRLSTMREFARTARGVYALRQLEAAA